MTDDDQTANPRGPNRPTFDDEWYVEKQFILLHDRLRRFPVHIGPPLQGMFAERLLRSTFAVDTPQGPLQFIALGERPVARGRTVLSKQPATIEWIDSFKPDSVFWDVGANVGVFSLYAARRGDIKVAAFEPAAVNYYLLAANAEANQLDARIDALPIGLGDRKAIARFDCTQFEPGKSFRVTTAEDEPPRAQQAVVVLTMDEIIEEYGLPCPNYIKIDAPRSTRAIIDGGARTLGRPEVRELHVEVRDTTTAGRRIIERLERHGFAIASRHEHGATDVIFSKPGA